MESEQVLSTPLSEMNKSLVTEGVEKNIFKIDEDGKPYAMKIYKSIVPGNNNVDRDLKARQEFQAYQQLRKTSLAPFIPEPIRIVTTQFGKAIGIVVEWREGLSVESGGVITESQIQDLERAFLDVTKSGLRANVDMYSEGNLMVGDLGVWIAECQVMPLHDSGDLYRKSVSQQMLALRSRNLVSRV